jgi:hypothetical protein
MLVLGYVARDPCHLGARAELSRGTLELPGATGVEPPAALGERPREREAEAA